MVERFQMKTEHDWICARLDEKGDWVRHSDYAKLAAENERLKQEAAEWEVIARAKSEEAMTHRREAEAMMAALANATLASTGAVKVKALEWTKLSTGWISHTSFHAYEVVATANGFMATYANMDFAWGAEDAMKLAAQADYERRILSALEPHPRATNPVVAHETANVSDKPEGQQEPVTEAAG